jgi:hypothetical protein
VGVAVIGALVLDGVGDGFTTVFVGVAVFVLVGVAVGNFGVEVGVGVVMITTGGVTGLVGVAVGDGVLVGVIGVGVGVETSQTLLPTVPASTK